MIGCNLFGLPVFVSPTWSGIGLMFFEYIGRSGFQFNFKPDCIF